MSISHELKEIQEKFDIIKKQLLEDSKKKHKKLIHNSINPVNISKALSKLLHIIPDTKISRADIYHRFYIYLIKHRLLNPNQTFTINDKIKKVFDTSKIHTEVTLKKLQTKGIDISPFITQPEIHVVNIPRCLDHNFLE